MSDAKRLARKTGLEWPRGVADLARAEGNLYEGLDLSALRNKAHNLADEIHAPTIPPSERSRRAQELAARYVRLGDTPPLVIAGLARESPVRFTRFFAGVHPWFRRCSPVVLTMFR